jgi:hypothetical protein
MLYAIQAHIVRHDPDGVCHIIACATFYVDGQLCGLDNERQAAAFARDRVLGPVTDPTTELHVTACTIAEYLARCGEDQRLGACAVDNACDKE